MVKRAAGPLTGPGPLGTHEIVHQFITNYFTKSRILKIFIYFFQTIGRISKNTKKYGIKKLRRKVLIFWHLTARGGTPVSEKSDIVR